MKIVYLLCFKIFPINICTLLHAFEPIVEVFLPLWLRYLQIMHSERINQVSKNFGLSFYFLRTGIKRSHLVPSQDYTANDSSNQCFEFSKMQLFEPMCESSHCRGEEWSVFGGWISWFLGRQLANKWLYTTQNCLFCFLCLFREWLYLAHVWFDR